MDYQSLTSALEYMDPLLYVVPIRLSTK